MNERPLRLRRITDPDTGGAVLVSFTAGMMVGVDQSMADLAGAIGAFADTGDVTGVIVHAGVGQSVFSRFSTLGCGTVVDLFGGTWLSTQPERREQICSLEHAVRVGADAVLMTISLGSPDEARQLNLCGQIARECKMWGMPLIARVDTTETDARRHYSATLTGHGTRLAYELGADLVIVDYSGEPEAFSEALSGIDIPALFGGSPDMATDETLVKSVQEAVTAGASGIALSASIFWEDGPSPALGQVAQCVLNRQSERIS